MSIRRSCEAGGGTMLSLFSSSITLDATMLLPLSPWQSMGEE